MGINKDTLYETVNFLQSSRYKEGLWRSASGKTTNNMCLLSTINYF